MKRKAGGAWSEKAVVGGGAHAQRPADVPPHQAWSSSAEGSGDLLARREKKLFLVPPPPLEWMREGEEGGLVKEEEEEVKLPTADVATSVVEGKQDQGDACRRPAAEAQEER